MKKLILFLIVFAVFTGCPSRKENEKKEIKPVTPAEKTIEDYIKIRGSYAGYIFKDGSQMYLARKKNVDQVYLDSPDGKAFQLTNGEDAVGGYTVSPDESKFIFITSKGGNEQYDFYLYTLKDRAVTELLVDEKIRYEDPKWINDSEILFTSNEVNGTDFYIYHLDLRTGKKTLLVEKKGYNSITDVKSKDDFLFYTFVGNNVSVPYRFRDGKYRKIRGASKERSYIPVGYFMGKILMKTNESADMEYLELWKNGKKEPFFRDKWEIEAVVIDKDSRDRAVFCTNEEGYSSCRFYNKGKIEKMPLEKSVVSLVRIKNGKVIYRTMNPDQISSPEAIDLETKQKITFGYRFSNGIDVTGFVSPELKKVKSFDGVDIPYFIYTPKNGKPPFKTLVYFHGGPSSQFRPYFITTFQYYLNKGYAIAAPNVRGSWGYGQEFMDMDNYKKRMDSVKDGKAVTDQLIKDGISKPDSFIAMGGSYGGFMVVASMAQYPQDYMCGIDSVGVVDFVNFLENTKAYRRKLREVEYGPLTDKEFLRSISPTNMVNTIDGALLVVHGANDPRVPVTDAYILIEKMKKAGKKVEKLIFDDEGHGVRKMNNRLIYYGKSAEFIESCK